MTDTKIEFELNGRRRKFTVSRRTYEQILKHTLFLLTNIQGFEPIGGGMYKSGTTMAAISKRVGLPKKATPIFRIQYMKRDA